MNNSSPTHSQSLKLSLLIVHILIVAIKTVSQRKISLVKREIEKCWIIYSKIKYSRTFIKLVSFLRFVDVLNVFLFDDWEECFGRNRFLNKNEKYWSWIWIDSYAWDVLLKSHYQWSTRCLTFNTISHIYSYYSRNFVASSFFPT